MFDRTLFRKIARPTDAEIVRTPPVVPLPILDNVPPILLAFDPHDLAIDLAYERDPVPGGTRVREASRVSTEYWIPRMTPVFSVSQGVVIYVQRHLDGHTIIVDHRNRWLSVYHRLEHVFLSASERQRETPVSGGDVLGYLAPSQPGPLKPLRFEMWKCDDEGEYEQRDPLRYIRKWRFIDWSEPRGATPR